MKKTSKLGSILKILFWESSILKFSLAALLGLGFSIAVILCAVGLMDGFEFSLKKALKKSEGDLTISKRGSFLDASDLSLVTKNKNIAAITGVLQSQGFLLAEGKSFGVILNGVKPKSYQKVTGVKLRLSDQGVSIGQALAKRLNIKIGDEISLLFARGNGAISDQPLLETFKVDSFFEHNIYEKSLRMIFLKEKTLNTLLQSQTRYNQFKIGLKSSWKEQQKIEEALTEFRKSLGEQYIVHPFWHDFEVLLEAVAVEKTTITIILQVIVVISLFNVIALFIYITEKKARDIFLLRALGINSKILMQSICVSSLFLWGLSCMLATGLKSFFGFLLSSGSWFKLPGDIYYLTKLSLNLDWQDYVYVFGISFLWLGIIIFFQARRLGKESIIEGLRKS